ncbi:hypothetical protein PMI40_03120 [Herbaspirillum sp. YR522]|nr:hypothetical protein PMI40_03120 [Herbaspirillum sp. YR522]
MISNIAANSTATQASQRGASHQTPAHGHAAQPTIRSPESNVTVTNNFAPSKQAEAKPSDSSGDKKKFDLGEMLKNFADVFKTVADAAGKIVSGISSVASGLIGAATKLIGMGK